MTASGSLYNGGFKTLSGLPAIQINGRKVLGPLPTWVGPEPNNDCEIFIKRIPRHLNENEILPHFERFGEIYQFRLMMEFNEFNRGYGYIRYTQEQYASKAVEVMNHFYILPGRCLSVQKSYDKCRLFVGNLPRNLDREEIEVGFRELFPNITKMVMHNRISDGNRNRGFAFLDFANHQEALVVKKQTTPGRMRKWDRDLKIVWANPERLVDPETMRDVKTLFVRNIDLSVNSKDLLDILVLFVRKNDIKKIARVREYAFLDFYTRETAELVLKGMQGIVLKGNSLEFDWALPPNEDSLHYLRDKDFDAILRMKCIANYWNVPIIIFGQALIAENIQYAAIMIRGRQKDQALFFEISTINLTDIHSRLCEAAVKIIEKWGDLPRYNYVIKIIENQAVLVGIVTDLSTAAFVKAANIKADIFLNYDEIRDLSLIMQQFSYFSWEQIVGFYRNAINNAIKYNYIEHIVIENRVLGCVNPTYRQKEPLRFNLDNTQIIFALCHKYSYTNYIFPHSQTILYNSLKFDNNGNEKSRFNIRAATINLSPLHISQPHGSNLNMVLYGYLQQYVNPNMIVIDPTTI